MYFGDSNTGFWVISILLAIVATVLAFIFIVPDKKREKMNAFGKFLHDTLNFKYLIIEKILQALYIFATAYTILFGFFLLFQTTPDYYGYGGSWLGGYGLLIMIFGPIVIRLVYELLMMTIILIKNVISINNKLKNQNDGAKNDFFSAPDISEIKADIQQRVNARKEAASTAPVAPEAAPVATPKFCPNCGSRLSEDGTCPNCNN